MRGMILAAGLGTRFKPWTDRHPKALAVINGKTLLERNIRYLQQAGIYEVVVNVHHFADQIIGAVQDNAGWGSKVIFSDERDEVLETGGGLAKAAPLLMSDTFVLMNADILTRLDLARMIAQHRSSPVLATLATTDRLTDRYFLFDVNDVLCGWKNTKTEEEKMVRTGAGLVARAFSGIHIIDPRLFSLIRQQGKFSMVDIYLSLGGSEIIKSFDHSGTAFIDVGRPEAVAQAEMLFAP